MPNLSNQGSMTFFAQQMDSAASLPSRCTVHHSCQTLAQTYFFVLLGVKEMLIRTCLLHLKQIQSEIALVVCLEVRSQPSYLEISIRGSSHMSVPVSVVAKACNCF